MLNRVSPYSDWSDDEYNPEWLLVDNVIKYLTKEKPHTEAEDIARAMRQPVHKIKEALALLKEEKPHLFRVTASDLGYVAILHRDAEGLKAFLEEGGFTKPHATAELHHQSETERRELESRKTKLEVAYFERQEAEARKTRRLSWIAIGISLLPFAVEGAKWLYSFVRDHPY